jgi:hypothetical protein
MERTLTIDDKPVRFKCTAGTVRVYRQLFQRDLFSDIQKLEKMRQKDDESISDEALSVFERIAYTMARQADDTIPESIDEWLDGFGMFSIYKALPEIIGLWGVSQTMLSPKKKATRKATGR